MGLHQNHPSSLFLSSLLDFSQSLEFLSALQAVYFTSMSTLDYGSNLGKVILKILGLFSKSYMTWERGSSVLCFAT